jgi:mercuric ion transport protein
MITREARATTLSLGGAILTTVATSSCCLGPLLLAALGIGGAGASAALAPFRPYLLVVTIALIATAFYFAYRKPGAGDGDACGGERSCANRVGRAGLWVASIVVVLMAFGPPLLARSDGPKHFGVASFASLATVRIPIQGIDCEACAGPIRAALTRVGGFHDLALDIAKQHATVTYEQHPERLAAYIAAINELGYESTMPDGSEGKR